MTIESEFQHRGFPVRLKYRGRLDGRETYHIFILTDRGPVFDTAASIFEAKRKAVNAINEWTSGDWTHTTGAVQCTTGGRDDFGSTGSVCRIPTEAQATGTARSA